LNWRAASRKIFLSCGRMVVRGTTGFEGTRVWLAAGNHDVPGESCSLPVESNRRGRIRRVLPAICFVNRKTDWKEAMERGLKNQPAE
jgi:hypothetical protein